jgi:hypothetical protein
VTEALGLFQGQRVGCVSKMRCFVLLARVQKSAIWVDRADRRCGRT